MNLMHMRRSEDVLHVFWMPDVYLIHVGSELYIYFAKSIKF